MLRFERAVNAAGSLGLDRQVGIVSSGSPSDDGFLWIHVENENAFSRLLRRYRKTSGKNAFLPQPPFCETNAMVRIDKTLLL
jgi:hypothetical protein